MRRVLLLLLLPLLLVGPALVPGRRFLPLLPVAFEPLASEHPAAAALAWERPNLLAVDALFPILSDRTAIRAMVLEGHLPLWQPLQGLGAPLLGGTIVGPLYPPNLLAILLPPELAAGWLALLALFLAGLGLWLLLERLGLPEAACALGAIALQGGGFALANLHYGMKVDAALWLPWQLWALEGLLARRRGSAAWLWASSALPFLAGFPGIAILSTAAACFYLAWRAVELRALTPAARGLGWIVLGVCAAGVQWIPTAEASAQSLRTPMAAAEIEAQALPLASNLGIVVPHLFGRPDSQPFADRDALTWRFARSGERTKAESANALEWNLFAGAAVLVLAIAALVAQPRRALAPACLLLLGLGFAQGWPGMRALYHLPPLALGAPARAASVAWVAWAWLAALGAQALLEGRARARASALACACMLVLLALALIADAAPQAWLETLPAELAARHGVALEQVRALLPDAAIAAAAARLRAGAWHLLAAAVAMALLVLAARWRATPARPRLLAYGMLAVIGLDGGWAGAAHLTPRRLGEGGWMPRSEALAAVARAAGSGRVLRIDTSASGIEDVVQLARPNLPELHGIGDLTPYIAFPPRRTVELLTALDPAARFRAGASRLSDVRLLGHPVLDLLRVQAVLARVPLEHPRLELVHAQEGLHVYRRRGAMSEATLVPGAATTASDVTALGLISSGAADPREVAVLAPGVSLARQSEAAGPFEAGELLVTRPAPARLDVEVRGTSGGWLLMSEAWAPGWRATLDGRGVPLVRADHALRAVHVPAGDHVVRTWYSPPGLWIGALLSTLALLIAASALLRARIRPGDRGACTSRSSPAAAAAMRP